MKIVLSYYNAVKSGRRDKCHHSRGERQKKGRSEGTGLKKWYHYSVRDVGLRKEAVHKKSYSIIVRSSTFGGKGHYCKEAEGWNGAKIKASWAHGDRCAMDILYTWTRQKNGGLKHISVVLEVPLGQNVLSLFILCLLYLQGTRASDFLYTTVYYS